MIRKILRKIARRSDGLYPLSASDERTLPEDYKGLIITSDIDRTYLATSIHSLRGLVKTALESADQKQAFTGMASLYRAFRHGSGKENQQVPLYFVSASPPQMEEVLREKMALDQIEVDGLTFKNQLRLLRKGRWREIKKHIVYKLTALLYNRSNRPKQAEIEEILIGDDSETDAEAYRLYARILDGSITQKGLAYALEGFRIEDKEKEVILTLAARQDQSRVKRIYIHCTTYQKPDQLFRQDPLLFAAIDSLQMALDALHQGWITQNALLPIAAEQGKQDTHDSFAELKRRNLLPEAFLDEQKAFLQANGV